MRVPGTLPFGGLFFSMVDTIRKAMKPQTVSTDGLPVAAQLALVTRGHIWLFALVILAALALRVWQISQATLDHYDEGVYAYSALAVAESFTRYPNQEVFSPPLYFTLAGSPRQKTTR